MKEKDIKKEESSESNSGLFKKKPISENEKKNIIRIQKDGKVDVKYEGNNSKKLETNYIFTEQDHGIELPFSDVESNKTLIVPSNIKEPIERIILKILFDEKSVKSLKALTDKVLEVAIKEKITISEKNINSIIYQLNKEKKIQFTQTDGWKIRI